MTAEDEGSVAEMGASVASGRPLRTSCQSSSRTRWGMIVLMIVVVIMIILVRWKVWEGRTRGSGREGSTRHRCTVLFSTVL